MEPVESVLLFQTKEPLILASASPRRREFFENLGLTFEVITAEVDETLEDGEAASDFVRRIAEDKARFVARANKDAWVVAADTVVVLDGVILGKPRDVDHALAMLRRLSSRRHEVWTGFCLCHGGKDHISKRAVRTEVCFVPLSEALCQAYVKTGEPFDKAGGYGIQGRGSCLVREIRGSYSNVVGLPLAELIQELLRQGVICPAT